MIRIKNRNIISKKKVYHYQIEGKKEVDKEMKEEELEKTTGGIEIERQMYQFR